MNEMLIDFFENNKSPNPYFMDFLTKKLKNNHT